VKKLRLRTFVNIDSAISGCIPQVNRGPQLFCEIIIIIISSELLTASSIFDKFSLHEGHWGYKLRIFDVSTVVVFQVEKRQLTLERTTCDVVEFDFRAFVR
jgi:hypothetical protein